MMASVGLGMSAFAAPGPDGFPSCIHASRGGRASTGDPQNHNPLPPCPFCFVAAQSAGQVPLLSTVPAFPVYIGSLITPLSDRIAGETSVPKFPRTVGTPRAPPAFSA